MRRLESWWRGVRADPRRADLANMVAMLLLGVALVAIGLVGLWSVDGDRPDADRWWHLVPLVAIAVLVPLRRARPVLALVAGLVVFAADLVIGGSLGVVVVLFDLLYSVARHGSARAVRWLVRIAVVVTIGALAVVVVVTGDARLGVFAGIQVFAIAGAPVWWGVNVRQEAALARAAEDVAELERERAEDLARMADLREAGAVREERARMARDLHDVIASHVSAVAIHAEAALARRPDAEADRTALKTMRASSVTALAEMRAMISLLRSDATADAMAAPPRLDRMDDLIAASRSAGLAIDADIDVAGMGVVGAATEQAAYRIVQEALTNAAKHASAARVGLGLRRVGHDLVVEVRSHGRRGVLAGSGGVGLVSMRERAEALGGTFTAGWEDGDWAVRARLPVVGTAA